MIYFPDWTPTEFHAHCGIVLDEDERLLFLVYPCPKNGAKVVPVPWLDTPSGLPPVSHETLYASAQAAAIFLSGVLDWDAKGCAYDYGPPLLFTFDSLKQSPAKSLLTRGVDDRGTRYVLHAGTPKLLISNDVVGKGFRLRGLELNPIPKASIPPDLLARMAALLEND